MFRSVCNMCQLPVISTKKYCSKSCYFKSLKGKQSHRKGSGEIIKKICPVCYISFFCSCQRGFKNKKTIFCSNLCRGKSKIKTGIIANTLTPTQAAYIAGLVDGEGSIFLVNVRGGCNIRLTIANSFKAVLDWVVETTGIGVVRTKQRKNPKHKTNHFFQANPHAAISIIKMIKPYLIIKQKQAQLAIETYDKLSNSIHRLDKSWQTVALKEMKTLNMRGPHVMAVNQL